jgi:small subunit ribosomal protein S6
MPFYETVFIARQDLTEQQVKDLAEGFAKHITDGKGKVAKTEHWGLRTLAYRINKNRKGHYVLIETDTDPAALHEMERNMRINEDVLRFLTVRNLELSKGQSAILEKAREYGEDGEGRGGFDRSDRGPRRPDRSGERFSKGEAA